MDNICKRCTKELETGLTHYERYKDTITKYRNKKGVREKIKAYQKLYRLKDPERAKARDKANYAKKKADVITCECGRSLMRARLKYHLQTKYHKSRMETIAKEKAEEEEKAEAEEKEKAKEKEIEDIREIFSQVRARDKIIY